MTTHLFGDCPAMVEGDEVLDLDALEIEESIFDCVTCEYVDRAGEIERARGCVSALLVALDNAEAVQAGMKAGLSKLSIFNRLLREVLHGVDESCHAYYKRIKPLEIMNWDEHLTYTCIPCDKGVGYSRTEGGVDVWLCENCGYELRVPILTWGSRDGID